MIRLEKNRSYKFALMPNINGEKDIESITFKTEDLKQKKYNFFCYAFYEGKLDVLSFGIVLKHYIHLFLKGHFSNSKGYIINYGGTEVLKKYYLSKNEYDIHIYQTDDFKDLKTDIIYHSPLNLFDPTSGLFLEFDTIEDKSHNFLKIIRTRITDGEPIFKNDEYLDLYDSVPTLQETKELRINGLSRVLTNFELCES